jgi:hypothetical protein
MPAWTLTVGDTVGSTPGPCAAGGDGMTIAGRDTATVTAGAAEGSIDGGACAGAALGVVADEDGDGTGL